VNSQQRRYDLDEGGSVALTLAVDHSQFLVVDRDSKLGDDDAYDSDAAATGLAVWADGVAVFCDSHWTTRTPVTLALADTEPTIDLDEFDHVVIAGLSCPSGELRIFGPEQTGAGELQVQLPGGMYGLAVCGAQFGAGDEYDANGTDRYTLTLWPCAKRPTRRVLKNGHPGAPGPDSD
jgi:hypothetical protein